MDQRIDSPVERMGWLYERCVGASGDGGVLSSSIAVVPVSRVDSMLSSRDEWVRVFLKAHYRVFLKTRTCVIPKTRMRVFLKAHSHPMVDDRRFVRKGCSAG